MSGFREHVMNLRISCLHERLSASYERIPLQRIARSSSANKARKICDVSRAKQDS
jgi:hypothetical protein